MTGEKRGHVRKEARDPAGRLQNITGPGRRKKTGGAENSTRQDSPVAAGLRPYALPAVLFLVAFFGIVTITNPALYISDEWITANQVHQLDLGHQVTFSEGKYGVTENGSVSGYFTARQNVLMYSLALPLAALPFVRIFSMFGDNFRMLVILAWSLCLVGIAVILEAFFPRYARIHGIRVFYPVVFFSFVLFMANILLYKQFPFSAPDAPFEVAALVLANHIFFALTVVLIFEILQAIRKDVWFSLFGTIACTACSSYLFWAGNAKDHMLTATLFTSVIFFFILYLARQQSRNAWLAFVCCGLLIWIRPEVGFFVTVFTGALFSYPLFLRLYTKETVSGTLAASLLPMAGAFLGGIPFFLNNLITTRNPLIPAFDLPRPLISTTTKFPGPLPIEEVTNNAEMVSQTAALGPADTVFRVAEIISNAMFRGFSFDNIVRGFSGVMLFPENGHIGFVIMCPLVVLALAASVLWYKKVLDVTERERYMYLVFFVLGFAAILAYLPKLAQMSMSSGILPDMRYLSPAYVSFGILSVLVLSRTPVLKNPRGMVSRVLLSGLFLVPLLFLAMIVIHPFGAINEGYTLFFKVIILAELGLAVAVMAVSRFLFPESRFLLRCMPWSVILLVVTVFTFQLVLVFIFGVIVKVNGYPLWIPLIREGFSSFFSVTVLSPG